VPLTHRRGRRWRSAGGACLAAVVLGSVALTGCSGDDSSAADRSPAQVLAAARRTLDRTSGVEIGLRTDDLPDGVTGVESAAGVGTHAPAFDG
jgi:lipoprotein LprG